MHKNNHDKLVKDQLNQSYQQRQAIVVAQLNTKGKVLALLKDVASPTYYVVDGKGGDPYYVGSSLIEAVVVYYNEATMPAIAELAAETAKKAEGFLTDDGE